MKQTTTDKRTSLSQATQLINDDDIVAFGGVTLYRRPVAFARALLQRSVPPHNLTLLCFTAGLESDLLVGAGRVSRVRTCYFGLEAFGLAPMFTKLASNGQIQVIEETEASLAFGLRATLAGVSFMPGLGWIGTDMLRVRPDVKLIDDPYGSEQYVAFPAVSCDVAVIHALRADPTGNAEIGDNKGLDYELGLVAKRVIVTAEEIVPKLEKSVEIYSLQVDAVVHAPRGAWPTSCHPLYPLDGHEIMHYSESCPDEFDTYLKGFLKRDAAPQSRNSHRKGE